VKPHIRRDEDIFDMRDRAPFDFSILLVALILMGLGIVMVYSASAILAAEKFNDSLYFLKKQVLFGAGGVLLMVIAMNLNYHRNWPTQFWA
jgi:cell division protein FtsW